MSELDTGFDFDRIRSIGWITLDEERYEIYEINRKSRSSCPCDLCDLAFTDTCDKIDDRPIVGKDCINNKYYFKKINPRKKSKTQYYVANIVKLAHDCVDMCSFYEKNCYNKNKEVCLLRYIENTCQKA